MNSGCHEPITASDCLLEAPSLPAVGPRPRPRWAETEGLPLPLGATWIEDEQAFNFAVFAEDAATVKLVLYSPQDLANPILSFQLDSLRNKSGRIWHCRTGMPRESFNVKFVDDCFRVGPG